MAAAMATTWSYVRPDKDLESPFSAKHLHRHQPFLRPNYSIVVDELDKLYQFTIQETSQQDMSQQTSQETSHQFLRLVFHIVVLETQNLPQTTDHLSGNCGYHVKSRLDISD